MRVYVMLGSLAGAHVLNDPIDRQQAFKTTAHTSDRGTVCRLREGGGVGLHAEYHRRQTTQMWRGGGAKVQTHGENACSILRTRHPCSLHAPHNDYNN